MSGTFGNLGGGGGSTPVSTCPVAPITRAALLALRAGGTLNPACHYVISDFTQGNLSIGTTIEMHAVAANELSQNVSVNTLFDNDAWYGRYDIDLNLLTELRDNRGNVVKDRTGASITAMPWGNANFTACEFDEAIIALSPSLVHTRVKAEGGSSLTTQNANPGSQFIDLAMYDGAVVTFNFSSFFVSGARFFGGTYTLTNLTSGGNSFISSDFYYSTINAGIMNNALTIARSTIRDSTLNLGSGPNTFRVVDSTIMSSTLTRANAAQLGFDFCDVRNGNIDIRIGALGLVRTTWRNSVFLAPGVGSVHVATSFNNCNVQNNATFTMLAALTQNFAQCAFGAQFSMNTPVGATGTLGASNCWFMGGTIAYTPTSANTTRSLNQCFTQFGSINFAGTTGYNAIQCGARSGGSITFGGNTGPLAACAVTALVAENGGTISVAPNGGSTANPILQRIRCGNGGTFGYTANAGPNVQLIGATADNAGTIALGGTMANISIANIKADIGGGISILTVGNAAFPFSMSQLEATGNGNITVTGITNPGIVNADVRRLKAHNSAAILINPNTLAAGALVARDMECVNQSAITMGAAALSLSRVRADNAGTYICTGGTTDIISVSDGFDLTGGTFSHSAVYARGNNAQVLSANNTNRGRDYFNNNLI